MKIRAEKTETAPADRQNRAEERAGELDDAPASTIPNNPASAVIMQRLQEFANSSPKAKQLKQQPELMRTSLASRQVQNFQHMADASPRATELKTQSDLMAGVVSPVVPTTATVQLEQKRNNTGLPDQLRSGIESLSGISMEHVRVHYNSAKPAQFMARAFAQDSEIHVAPGEEQHLPHEAWHVVQQAQGRVRPTFQMSGGIAVNDDVSLEREADLMGAHALNNMQSLAKGGIAQRLEVGLCSQPVVQRYLRIDEELLIGEIVQDIEMLELEEADKAALIFLARDNREWNFSNQVEAIEVGKMLLGMDEADSYSFDALELDPGLLSILTHFRDADHAVGGMNSNGEQTPIFPIGNPNPENVLGINPSNLRDPDPTEGRRNEALITAIKLKSMQMPEQVALEGVQAIDYQFKDANSKTRYGFDPFEMPNEGIGDKEAREAWLGDAYEKHVRGKKANVGEAGEMAHYSGLLDVSGITAEELNTLVNAITEYEKKQKNEKLADYEKPNLSLINSHLADSNVAKYDYSELEVTKEPMEGLGAMFG